LQPGGGVRILTIFAGKEKTMGRRRDRKDQRLENQIATRRKNAKRKERERARKAAKAAAAAEAAA